MEFDNGDVNFLILRGDNFLRFWKCCRMFIKLMFIWFENGLLNGMF